jgi:hypothetical protein
MTDTLSRSQRIHPSELEGMDLGEHDGLPITQSSAQITNAGDGLSESLAMSAVHIPVESEVVIVLTAKVKRHSYERVVGAEKSVKDEFVEVTTYRTDAAFMIDPDLLEEAIAKHMERRAAHRSELERLRKAAKGEFELPFIGGEGTNGDGAA